MPDPSDIDSAQIEDRRFPPPAEFSARARIRSMEEYRRLYQQSIEDPDGFWGERARELEWAEPFTQVLDWQPPHARWFVGGKINVSVNCLDRHVARGLGDRRALVWEGEPGEQRALTYAQLLGEVCRCANLLASLGVKAGDRVGIYLPLVPEVAIAMLACTRIGAIHSVVFAGFSAEAVRDRMADAGVKVLITADGSYRKGQLVPLKPQVDRALEQLPQVAKVLVLRRTGSPVAMKPGRDLWWADAVDPQPDHSPAAAMDSEAPLFILYTSGTTGKPKGVVHSTAGYLLQAGLTTRWVFDLRPEDLYWCTADVGWITGHSYVVYGPLAEGATVFMYEGALNHPVDRIWDLIERHQVSILYTAPTAIRSFIKVGDQHPNRHDLTSLRLLGTVGEPINPEAWIWYHQVIGGGRCPIVDTWWQTETGSIAVSPLPGATPTKPGSATFPLPGMVPEVLDAHGQPVPKGQGGSLFLTRPWPSMLRSVYGDPARYVSQYFSQVPGKYFTGDGARFDKDGYLWLMGRIDDVIKISGHRLGTAEIESALVTHPAVAEAAVVGRPDEIKGNAIAAFVTLKAGQRASKELKQGLRAHVAETIGALARPDDVHFADGLPKTRSGKIMRRLLRDVASGSQTTGDTTTLEDLSVLAALRADEEE